MVSLPMLTASCLSSLFLMKQSQRSFCESLSKDKVERDACLMRICKAVRLISVDPGTVIIKQGDGTASAPHHNAVTGSAWRHDCTLTSLNHPTSLTRGERVLHCV